MQKSPIWHPYTPGIVADELHVKSASGAHLLLKDGRRITDAISSWWVTLHGHAHPAIAEAIAKQAHTLEQVIFSGFTHQPAETLAQRLLTLVPGGMSRVFFSDNGSTAVEVALKMALQHFDIQGEKRQMVLALENGYHGDTFGTMSVSARGPFNQAFTRWLFEARYITPPYSQHIDALPSPDWEVSLAKAEKLLKTKQVAALIVEPLLQGAGGMKLFPKLWLETLFHLARKYQTLIIADEVFTGFYRTGKPFSSHHLEVQPDIFCISKGLTGGFMPMGITLCNEMVAAPFYPATYEQMFYHGHSFTGNPLACAAANASLDLTEMAGFKAQIAGLVDFQENLTSKVRLLFPQIETRGIGTISAFTLGKTGMYSHPIRQKIYTYFLAKNILIRPLGNTFYLVPIYCTSHEDLNNIADAILDFLGKEAG